MPSCSWLSHWRLIPDPDRLGAIVLEDVVAMIDMKALALSGARLRLTEIDAERKALLGAFPSLRPSAGTQEVPPRRSGTPGQPAQATARRRPKMTAAQKKAVGARMKKYWAERKAKEAKAR